MNYFFLFPVLFMLSFIIFGVYHLLKEPESVHPLALDEETDAKIAAQIEADKPNVAEWNRRVAAGEVEDGELPF